MLINFLNSSPNKSFLYQINCKNNHNLMNFMWCTCVFLMYIIMFKNMLMYIYELCRIQTMSNINFAYIVSVMGWFKKQINK
jgi:hypothetical protein